MKKKTVLNIVAAICFVLFVFMAIIGYNKITKYNNSSVSQENAYVGGDAYNYIINGTYATAYFTLASGFFISGIVCWVGALVIPDQNENTKVKDDELPEL